MAAIARTTRRGGTVIAAAGTARSEPSCDRQVQPARPWTEVYSSRSLRDREGVTASKGADEQGGSDDCERRSGCQPDEPVTGEGLAADSTGGRAGARLSGGASERGRSCQ